MAGEATDADVQELLKALALFQARLKERDPVNAKLKQRFVLGLKQATNAVKANKVKALLLAPDTEASDAVDDKLQQLVALAIEREIVVLFCLNRRKLGRAVDNSMKQAVVAVFDPDGAYDKYKKIVAFCRPPSEI